MPFNKNVVRETLWYWDAAWQCGDFLKIVRANYGTSILEMSDTSSESVPGGQARGYKVWRWLDANHAKKVRFKVDPE